MLAFIKECFEQAEGDERDGKRGAAVVENYAVCEVALPEFVVV